MPTMEENESNVPYLHVYAQEAWHGTAYVIGTRPGLTALKSAIEKALAGTRPDMCEEIVYVTDGEGYTIVVSCLEEEKMFRMVMPYINEMAQEEARPARLWPEDLGDLI